MATVGNTAEPTSTSEFWGLNSTNQMATLVTMPSGGPWLIKRLGCWLAGVNASASVRLCVWSEGGTLLAQSATISVAGLSFALGANYKTEASITSLQVSGGQKVYVGFWRSPSDDVQNGRHASGSHLHDYPGSAAASFSGESTDTAGALGAYIADYATANVAPTAPTNLTPGGTIHTGRTIAYAWTHNDPDGNAQAGYEWRLFTTAGAQLDIVTSTSSSKTLTRTLPSGHDADKEYDFDVRTKDSGGLWGPRAAKKRFRPNSVPSTPAAPTISSSTTLTPTIAGSFSDPDDGATLAAIQIEVELSASPYTDKWVTGDLAKSGSTWTAVYAGSALSWSIGYRVRARTKDQYGAYSAWSAYTTWTTSQPLGPDNLTPSSTEAKQNSLTPTLTIGHSATLRNDQVQVRTADNGGGILLWDKLKDGVDYTAVTSKARVYAGTALSWGVTYWWRALIELSTGVDTAWSSWYPFRINALPTGPTVLTVSESTTGELAIINTAGIRVTTDTTPKIRATFADPDRASYGDAPSARSFEIRRKDTQVALTSTTTLTTEDWTPTVAMLLDVEYQVRAGYRDNAGQPAGTYAYSAWFDLKASAKPTVALTAPAAAAVVTESTPVLDWTFTGSAGKAQRSYRVEVFDLGPTGALFTNEAIVYDSGTVLSTATAQALPRGILLDDHDYRWQVTATDADGLATTLA